MELHRAHGGLVSSEVRERALAGDAAALIADVNAEIEDLDFVAPVLIEYDLEAARAKMKEAVKVHGGPIPEITLLMPGSDTVSRQMGELMQQIQAGGGCARIDGMLAGSAPAGSGRSESVIEGLFLFAAPAGWKRMAEQLQAISNRSLRIYGGVMVGVGLIALQLLR